MGQRRSIIFWKTGRVVRKGEPLRDYEEKIGLVGCGGQRRFPRKKGEDRSIMIHARWAKEAQTLWETTGVRTADIKAELDSIEKKNTITDQDLDILPSVGCEGCEWTPKRPVERKSKRRDTKGHGGAIRQSKKS